MASDINQKTNEERIKKLESSLRFYKLLYWILFFAVACMYLALGKYWRIF